MKSKHPGAKNLHFKVSGLKKIITIGCRFCFIRINFLILLCAEYFYNRDPKFLPV